MNPDRRVLVVEDDLGAANAARRAASEEGNRRALAHLAGDIGEGEGQCGGYYHCPTCAAEIGRAKDAENARDHSRSPTREERAQERAAKVRRRAKAKAARRARKAQRRRSR